MKFTIDRIEENFAVLESEEGYNSSVSLSELPNNIREGCVIIFSDGVYSTDILSEQEKRNRIYELKKKLNKIEK